MEKTMIMKRMFLALFISAVAILLPPKAQASNIKIAMTVDNSYALFYGTQAQATNFVGSNGSWSDVETYTFTLDSSKYLYVVTASDRSAAQGFLGQFENLTSGYKFYSNDPQWQVTATGLGSNAPYTGTLANFALLNHEIQDANAGGNPSNGWVSLTAGPANGASPWGHLAGIDSAAHWVWYSSNGDPDPTTPGFNHQEWLVFRIAIAATPDIPIPLVPEPSQLLMLLVGGMAIALQARRAIGARLAS
jgi:hypothetical protein